VRAITSGVFHPAQEQRVVNPYVPLLASLVIAVVFSLVFVGLSKFFGPHRPTATKTALYECGMPTIGPVHQRFSVKFYLVAVLFILFDLEAVFLYPWAVTFRDFVLDGKALFVFSEMLIFLGVLFLGWLYCLKRGAFEWD
jgi:NADH-quinone oxidoreductase subunit A